MMVQLNWYIQLNITIHVLTKRRNLDETDKHRGKMLWGHRYKGYLIHPEARREAGNILPQTLRRDQPCWHHGFWTSRTSVRYREKMFSLVWRSPHPTSECPCCNSWLQLANANPGIAQVIGFLTIIWEIGTEFPHPFIGPSPALGCWGHLVSETK